MAARPAASRPAHFQAKVARSVVQEPEQGAGLVRRERRFCPAALVHVSHAQRGYLKTPLTSMRCVPTTDSSRSASSDGEPGKAV